MTSLSVNFGVLDVGAGKLQEVPFSNGTAMFDGEERIFADFYYPRYPNMNTVRCFLNKGAKSGQQDDDVIDVCFILMGKTYVYPVYNHLGYFPNMSFAKTLFCSCSEEIMSNKDLLQQCDNFLMMTGFLFYNFDPYTDSGASESLNNLLGLISQYEGIDMKLFLNHDAYNASKDGMSIQFTQAERETFYEFCKTPSGQKCSILTIFSGSDVNNAVSEYYYRIPHGHCTDTFSVSQSAQESMKNKSPVSLFEQYYECHRSIEDILIATLGIAVGNVVSIKSGLVILFTYLLTQQAAKAKKAAKKREETAEHIYLTYGSVERNEVLQYLAFNLLLARDGKYSSVVYDPNQKGGSLGAEQSLIKELADEMKVHPALKRFFVVNESPDTLEQQNPINSSDGVEMTSSADNSDRSQSSFEEKKKRFAKIYDLSRDLKEKSKNAYERDLLINPMYQHRQNRKMEYSLSSV